MLFVVGNAGPAPVLEKQPLARRVIETLAGLGAAPGAEEADLSAEARAAPVWKLIQLLTLLVGLLFAASTLALSAARRRLMT